MIYFVQAGNGPIKIGAARDPLKRVATLRTASPEPLRLLCIIDGDLRDEKNLHRRFAAERLRGEWFDPSGRLVSFIALCRRMVEKDENPGLWLAVQLRDPLPISDKDQRTFDRWERERLASKHA